MVGVAISCLSQPLIFNLVKKGSCNYTFTIFTLNTCLTYAGCFMAYFFMAKFLNSLPSAEAPVSGDETDIELYLLQNDFQR